MDSAQALRRTEGGIREFPKIRGTLFGGPYNNKDPTIWGTILGSPIFGNSQVSADAIDGTSRSEGSAGRHFSDALVSVAR